MPYFRTARIEPSAPSYRAGSLGAYEGGTTYPRKSLMLGFDTHSPTGDDVVEVALKTAEPYLWYLDLNRFKANTAIAAGEFDPSLMKTDRGHTWYLEEHKALSPFDFTVKGSTQTVSTVNGFPYIPGGPDPFAGMPASTVESDAALWYGRMAPVVSEFSLGTFLGELREELPRVIPGFINKAQSMRSVGGDYLNLEFGWKPLLSDLRGLATALTAASAGLFRPMSSSHRKRELPRKEAFTRFDLLARNNVPVFTGDYVQSIPDFPIPNKPIGSTFSSITSLGSALLTTTTDRWFEGEFVFIPKAGFNPKSYLDRLETLMSVDITPSVLWNLAPWSWLVDWSNDIGSAIASMEAASSSRILTSYYYGMEDVSVEYVARLRGIQGASGVLYTGPSDFRSAMSKRRRKRVRGNPYGYTGTTNASLTGSQWSILGALGITKIF